MSKCKGKVPRNHTFRADLHRGIISSDAYRGLAAVSACHLETDIPQTCWLIGRSVVRLPAIHQLRNCNAVELGDYVARFHSTGFTNLPGIARNHGNAFDKPDIDRELARS